VGSWAVIERIGIQALCVLIIVWVYFIVQYVTPLRPPQLLNTIMIVVGIASGIGVVLWLSRNAKSV